jgi:hypothetical protein
MSSIELLKQIERAASWTKKLIKQTPERSGLRSILAQLLELQSIYLRDGSFAGVPKDRLTMGVIAAKSDFDVIYPEYAELVHDISYAIEHQKT